MFIEKRIEMMSKDERDFNAEAAAEYTEFLMDPKVRIRCKKIVDRQEAKYAFMEMTGKEKAAYIGKRVAVIAGGLLLLVGGAAVAFGRIGGTGDNSGESATEGEGTDTPWGKYEDLELISLDDKVEPTTVNVE